MRGLWMIGLWALTCSAVADEALWKRLQQDPNMIVLMRNSVSVGQRDGVDMLTWDASGKCKGESKLSAEGRAHAERIGAAFADRGIRPTVISSPMCRCAETAEIAFGAYSTDPELRQRPPQDVSGQKAFQAVAKDLMARHRGATPIVFVNHRPNIDALTMELIAIGDLLVGTVSELGDVEIVGTIRLD